MRKTGLILILLFSSTLLCAQQVIKNIPSEAHQNIRGTKISIVPPEGFTSGLNFFGLQQAESGSSIMVVDIPGPYSAVSKGITKENMLSKGVEVSSIENMTLNGLPAVFVTGRQYANGNSYIKYILVLGSELETIMINGVCPETFSEIGNKIKESMLSVIYNAGQKTDVLAHLDYSIDVTGAKLKFAKSLSNSIIFSVDGQVPAASADKTSLIVAKSFSPVTATDKKLYAINRVKQTPMEVSSVDSVREITIDGISGYEIEAKGKYKNTGATESIYQVILFSDNLYYIFWGTTNDATGKRITEIKKAVGTFKRK